MKIVMKMMKYAIVYKYIPLHLLILCIVSSTQCMEQNIVTLDSYIIRKFIKVTTKNKFHLPGFSRRSNRITSLQQLADQGADITFNTKDEELPSWLHKDIDQTQKMLYKLFCFLSYNKNSTPTAAQHTTSEQPKTYTDTLYHNNSLLQITTQKTLKNDTQRILSNFLCEYEYNNKTIHISQQAEDQSLTPDQDSINAWHTYLQLVKNEIELIKPKMEQGILRLNKPFIKHIIYTKNKITENKFTDPTNFQTRLRRLKILKEVAQQGADITFADENLTCLHDTFFLLLNYNKIACQATVNHTSLYQPGFIATICLNNSLLQIIGSKCLLPNTKQNLENFLQEYEHDTEHKIELAKPEINMIPYQKSLHIDSSLIREFIKINQKNELHRPYVETRAERLTLLQQLIDQGAVITFESEDQDLTLWISRNEPNIYQNAFYDKLLSFVNCTLLGYAHAQHFTHILYFRDSFLYITIAETFAYEAEQTLQQFLNKYHRARYAHIKKNITDNDEDDHDCFETLPYNTQELLIDICS
jgi:hypothetical protein